MAMDGDGLLLLEKQMLEMWANAPYECVLIQADGTYQQLPGGPRITEDGTVVTQFGILGKYLVEGWYKKP